LTHSEAIAGVISGLLLIVIGEPALGGLESDVIRALARADGVWLKFRDLAAQLETSRLLVEQAIDNLHALDFLLDSHNYVHGTSYRLSQSGRDFAIRKGYVR
jgi:hypothetical protein